jgi:hypothetical protein
METPQPIAEALTAALSAKTVFDTATTAKATTAQALTDAQGADTKAAQDLGTAKDDLTAKVKALQAAVAAYFPVVTG